MIVYLIIIVVLLGTLIGYQAINKVTTPYEKWTRDEFLEHFEKHENIINLSPSMKSFYYHTIYSEAWEPSIDFNGCSVVQDKYHPCPDCWIHDFLWKTGQGGYLSDRLFYRLMIASGMKKGRARARWFFVRVGWIFFYKWKHLKHRNVNGLSEEFITIVIELGLSKRFV